MNMDRAGLPPTNDDIQAHRWPVNCTAMDKRVAVLEAELAALKDLVKALSEKLAHHS